MSKSGTKQTMTPAAIALIRKRGGKGGIPKIAAHPELLAFVLERIYTHTYRQIADEVALKFPPDRRASLSALSRWWKSQDQEALWGPDKNPENPRDLTGPQLRLSDTALLN